MSAYYFTGVVIIYVMDTVSINILTHARNVYETLFFQAHVSQYLQGDVPGKAVLSFYHPLVLRVFECDELGPATIHIRNTVYWQPILNGSCPLLAWTFCAYPVYL